MVRGGGSSKSPNLQFVTCMQSLPPASGTKQTPISFMIFSILFWDGIDVRGVSKKRSRDI